MTTIVVLLVLLASCSARVERSRSELVQVTGAEPATLNPILATDSASLGVVSHIFETLTQRDFETIEIKPLLATHWDISADKLTYTFWIREGVKWHDGRDFSVDDVVYTFERIKDPKVDAAQYRNYFADVETVEKVGDNAVRFTCRRPYFKLLEMIGGAPIIPKHIFDDGTDFNKNPASRKPVGTGPFKFGEWKTGRLITLEKFDGYWGELPAITGLKFKIIPEQTISFGLLKKGAIDLSLLSGVQWARQTEGAKFAEKFMKLKYYLPNYRCIAWNLRNPIFADGRVRRSMTMLIDREKIIREVLFGQGEIVTNNFYRFGNIYDESIVPYPYDPAKAKELLKEAGFKDTNGDGILEKDGFPLSFSLMIRAEDPFARTLGIILKEEISRVGGSLSIRQFESATLIGKLKTHEFDAAFIGYSTTFEEDPYQMWHSSQIEEGSNVIGFKNERIDEIVEKARMEFDVGRRRELYREFQLIMHEEEPFTFLFTVPVLAAVAKRFENVKAYRRGLDILKWKVRPGPVLWEW